MLNASHPATASSNTKKIAKAVRTLPSLEEARVPPGLPKCYDMWRQPPSAVGRSEAPQILLCQPALSPDPAILRGNAHQTSANRICQHIRHLYIETLRRPQHTIE